MTATLNGQARHLPYDMAVEQGFVGWMLVDPIHLVDAVGMVSPPDFADPCCADVWSAILTLHNAGVRPDAILVRDELSRLGLKTSAAAILEIQSAASGSWREYGVRVVRLAAARKLMTGLTGHLDALNDGIDAFEVGDRVAALVKSLDTPTVAPPPDLYDFTDFLAQSEELAPWVIPGLLRQGQRATIVAGEGSGKSLALQQIALCAAAGVHPFDFKPIDPVTVLIVDLENDSVRIRFGAELVERGLGPCRRFEGGVSMWSRPGGIDIRQRHDRSEFDATLQKVRPQLVVLGPLYNAFDSKASESDDRVAGEVQHILNDLRRRHRFALVMEDHAPHGDSYNRRMRPFGSSRWLRWPEYGLGLEKSKDIAGSLNVTRWRGDRLPGGWPDRLDRGTTFPFVGRWNEAPHPSAPDAGEF